MSTNVAQALHTLQHSANANQASRNLANSYERLMSSNDPISLKDFTLWYTQSPNLGRLNATREVLLPDILHRFVRPVVMKRLTNGISYIVDISGYPEMGTYSQAGNWFRIPTGGSYYIGTLRKQPDKWGVSLSIHDDPIVVKYLFEVLTVPCTEPRRPTFFERFMDLFCCCCR
jgi:hypothetical protein